MEIFQSSTGYRVCLSPKELAIMVINDFFTKLFSNKELGNKSYDSKEVKDYIIELSKKSIDSKEYEYHTALLELYQAFDKKCDFCFKLKAKYDPKKHKISTMSDLEKFNNDPPDLIIKYQKHEFSFELKRYRGKITFDDMYAFIKRKIIDHYSGQLNFLILLQPEVGSSVDFNIFRQIHKRLKKEKNQPGYIGFTFNRESKEIITVRVAPKLDKSVRPFSSQSDIYSDLLNSK